MAPKKQQKKVFDYSGLEKGMTLQAEGGDGSYYAATVVAVSTAKNRSKAPVKVSFKGYEGYDEWVSGDRLRSKALKEETPEKKEKPEKKFKIPTGTFTVYYHGSCKGFYGRALAIMGMLEEAGAKYECKDGSEFPGKGFAPPMCASPKGAMCSQTTAISVVMGRELGFSPKDPKMYAKAYQLCEDFNDLMTEDFAKKPDDRLKKWLQHLEELLTAKYFCGDSLSFADFHGIMLFTGFSQSHADLMKEFPKLTAWIEAMKDTAGYKKLKESGVPFLPESMGGVKLL